MPGGHTDANATDENAPGAIIFTSGTQGRAKAVVLAHRSLLANQRMLLHVTRRLPYQPDMTAGATRRLATCRFLGADLR